MSFELPRPPQAGLYRVLVVDPPWNQRKTGRRRVRPNQSQQLDYPTLTEADLRDLPIAEWADPEQSFVWLWTTNSKDQSTRRPLLPTAFDLLDHWGFTFYTMITWNKSTGPCPFGPYQIITEHILFGYRGKATFPPGTMGQLQTCFTAPPGSHSSKPQPFYDEIARLFPGPRLDVFSRQCRPGFDGWGNEHGVLPANAPRRNLNPRVAYA